MLLLCVLPVFYVSTATAIFQTIEVGRENDKGSNRNVILKRKKPHIKQHATPCNVTFRFKNIYFPFCEMRHQKTFNHVLFNRENSVKAKKAVQKRPPSINVQTGE